MFTGIVQAVGRVARATRKSDGLRIAVDAGALDRSDIAIGDSVAVNGCCLTVVAQGAGMLEFDVSAETLRCSHGLDVEGEVNLEKSLRLSDRLGGHLVAGHVDGTGLVADFARVGADASGSWRLAIDAPLGIARFIAAKGSVAVHGVSLTVNEVNGVQFSVNLIPHTLAVTNLRKLARGARVNLEVDMVARYVARLDEFRAGQ